jgi:hypothetical protein
MNESGKMVDSTKVTKDLKLIWCKEKDKVVTGVSCRKV